MLRKLLLTATVAGSVLLPLLPAQADYYHHYHRVVYHHSYHRAYYRPYHRWHHFWVDHHGHRHYY